MGFLFAAASPFFLHFSEAGNPKRASALAVKSSHVSEVNLTTFIDKGVGFRVQPA
jgi:hypothetical protein